MLRGYRGIILAVGLALAGAAQPQEHSKSSQATEQKGPAIPLVDDYAPYPSYDPDPCYKAKNHDTADLCAQWRAALAAEKAAESSIWGNKIAGAGAILSFISIALVFFALRQTEKSLKMARDANEITRKHQRARLEAKIRIIPWQASLGFDLALGSENIGETPALNVTLRANLFDRPPQIPPMDEAAGHRHTVMPGQIIDMAQIIRKDGIMIGSYVAGVIEYDTIFEGPHRSYFCWIIRAEDRLERVRSTDPWVAVPAKPDHWPPDT